jgi:Tat protein secretion system quality control protein TatD with DNase activity
MVRHTLEKLAELRGIASLELAAQTTQNAHRLFNRWHTTMPSQLT